MALRRALLPVNPALWLACRERWQAVSLWIVALLSSGVFVAVFAVANEPLAWVVWSSLAGLVTFILYLGVASQAVRFFVEAQRSGLFELLLATPLSGAQVVDGHWRGLLRLFGFPVLICLVAQLMGGVLVQQMTWTQMSATTAATAPAIAGAAPAPTNASTAGATNPGTAAAPAPAVRVRAVPGAGFEPPGLVVALAMSVGATLTIAANLAALGWVGMWIGLNSRSANLATLKTFLFVQVIPWFVIALAAGILASAVLIPTVMKGAGAMPGRFMLWFPLVTAALTTVLYLAKDAGFILWARHRLSSQFRERAARALPAPGVVSRRPQPVGQRSG